MGVGPTAGDIIDAFMASAPHRADILDRDDNQVGVATAEGGGRLRVAEVFRQPTGGAPTAPSTRTTAPSTRATAPAGRASGSSQHTAPPRGTGSSTPPPAPSSEELLRARATVAAAGPGAAPAATPVDRVLRSAAVLSATHG